MADLFLNPEQERSVNQAQKRGLGLVEQQDRTPGPLAPDFVFSLPETQEPPSVPGLLRRASDVGVEVGSGFLQMVGAFMGLSEFGRNAVVNSMKKYNDLLEIKQDPNRFNALDKEQQNYVDKVVSEESPTIFQRGLYNIFTAVANGGKLLNNAGEELEKALVSQDQQEKEAQYYTQIQEAMANIPPPPQQSSNGDKVAYYLDYIRRGGGAALQASIDHPGAVIGIVIKSLPMMVGGGVAGGAVRTGAKAVGKGLGRAVEMSPTTAAAIGEGIISAGSSAQTTGGDPLSALSGAATGAIALGGGSIARRMGVTDPDALVAGKLNKNLPVNLAEKAKGRIGRTIGGAVTEAGEEFAQSAQEQALQNQATGRPWYEGVGEQAVQGALAGAGLGGGLNFLSNAPKTVQDVRNERQSARDDQSGALNQKLSDIENNISGLSGQAPEEFAEDINNLSEQIKQEKENILQQTKSANENDLDRIDYPENTISDLEQKYEELSFDINEKIQNTMNEENDLLARFGEGFPTFEEFLNQHIESMIEQAQTNGTTLNNEYVQWKKDNEKFSGDNAKEFLKEFVSSNEDLLRQQYKQSHLGFAQEQKMQAENAQMPVPQNNAQFTGQPAQPTAEPVAQPNAEPLALPAREEDLASEVAKKEEAERIEREKNNNIIARYPGKLPSKQSFRAQRAKELKERIEQEGTPEHEAYIKWKKSTGKILGDQSKEFINLSLTEESLNKEYQEEILRIATEYSKNKNKSKEAENVEENKGSLILPGQEVDWPSVIRRQKAELIEREKNKKREEKENEIKAVYGGEFQSLESFKKGYAKELKEKIQQEGAPEHEDYIKWKKRTKNFTGNLIPKFIKESGLMNEEKINKEYNKELLQYSKNKEKIKNIEKKYRQAKKDKKLTKILKQFGYAEDKLGEKFYNKYPELEKMFLTGKGVYSNKFKETVDRLAEPAKPAAKPNAEPVAKPNAQPNAEPAAKPASKSVAKQGEPANQNEISEFKSIDSIKNFIEQHKKIIQKFIEENGLEKIHKLIYEKGKTIKPKVAAYIYAATKLGEDFYDKYPELKRRILNNAGIYGENGVFRKIVNKESHEKEQKEKTTDQLEKQSLAEIISNYPKEKNEFSKNTHKGMLYKILTGEIQNNKGFDLIDAGGKIIPEAYFNILKESNNEEAINFLGEFKHTDKMGLRYRQSVFNAWKTLQKNLLDIIEKEFTNPETRKRNIDAERRYYKKMLKELQTTKLEEVKELKEVEEEKNSLDQQLEEIYLGSKNLEEFLNKSKESGLSLTPEELKEYFVKRDDEEEIKRDMGLQRQEFTPESGGGKEYKEYNEQTGGIATGKNLTPEDIIGFVKSFMSDSHETLEDGSKKLVYGLNKTEAQKKALDFITKSKFKVRGNITLEKIKRMTENLPDSLGDKSTEENQGSSEKELTEKIEDLITDKFDELEEIGAKKFVEEIAEEIEEMFDEGALDRPNLLNSASLRGKIQYILNEFEKENETQYGIRQNKNASTASKEEFKKLFRNITGNQEPDNVHIHDTLEDAAKSVDNPEEIRAKKPFGFVVKGKGKPQVHLILEMIPFNGEMAAFMHEVGSHIGMDSLPLEDRNKVVNQIAKWANDTGNEDENKVARRAFARVRAAFSGDINDAQSKSETIAYFLEEAANAGYMPNNQTKLGRFIARIIDLFKKGLEIFGIKNNKLTMQNIVDMAYGAAKVQLYDQGFYPENLGESQEINFGVNAQQLKEMVGESSAKFLTDGKYIFRKAVQSVQFLHNIIRDNKDKMPGLNTWYQNILNLDMSKNSILQKVEEIVNHAQKLPQEKINQINEFLSYSTYYQAWGYDPKIKGSKIKIDPIAQRKFNALDQVQKGIVQDVFSYGEEMKNRMKKIAEETGVSVDYFSDSKLNGPYAPLKRFGNFITEMKSQELLDAEKKLKEKTTPENITRINKLKSQAEHYVISFFDTPSKAKNFEQKNKGKYAKINTYEKEKAMNEGLIAPQLIEQMLGKIEATVDPQISEQFKKILYDMYFSSLSDRDARLSGKKRMNRAGYNPDMLRSFVSHAKSQATQIAYMENGKNINESLSDIKQQIKEADGEERARRQEIYNLVIKHYNKHLRNKSNSLINTITSANSFYMLTSSIGYHLSNATQPLMVTMPKLNGDFGNVAKNWERLFNGYKLAKKAINFDPLKQTVMIDMGKMPERYRSLLEALRERNILDIGLAEDLSVFDKFESGYEVIDKFGSFVSKIMHRSYQVARLVESYNRIASAIAAYDTASKKGYAIRKGKRISPMEYAVEVIEDTQGNFSNLDAPYVIKYLPKIVTQFKKFQFMMAHMYVDSFLKAFKGADAHERAVGRRTLGWLLAHTGLVAGLNGVPLASSIAGLFMFMGGADEPKDLEEYIREHTKDQKFATLLAKGIPSFLGVDMGRLGQPGVELFSPLPYNKFSVKSADQDFKDAVYSAIGGPLGATGLNIYKGFRELNNGDYLKGVGHMLPKGMRNALEAYGYKTEGYKLNNGDVIVDPRDVDFITLLSNFIGLTPEQISHLRWTNAQQNKIQDYYSSAQTEMKKDFTAARANGDGKKMAEIRKKWNQLQEDKDKIRPFFNDSRNVLRRSPASDLYKYQKDIETRTKRERERLTGS